MKLFKNFIIPFILAIIVFSPCRKISALSYESYNFDDTEINTFYDALKLNSSISVSNYNVYFGMYSSGQFITLLLPPDNIQTGFKASTNVDCFFSTGSLKSPIFNRSQFSQLSSTSFTTAYDVNSFSGKYVLFYLPSNNILCYADCFIDGGKYWGNAQNIVAYAYISAETDPSYDYFGKNPLGLDIDGFMEWLSNNPEFADIIKNNAPFLELDTLGKLKFLMQYYDDYGTYADGFAYNFLTGLNDIIDRDDVLDMNANDIQILRNVLKMQYNKYINSKTPPVSIPTNSPYIPSDNPVVVPSGTPSGTIVIENNNDANYYYLREIIRLLNIDINNNNSFQYTNSNFFNSIIDSLNDVLNDLYLLLAPVNSITDKLVELNNNLLNIIPSGSCNYDESFWEYMLTPTYSGFDDLQQICVDKFPVLDQITEVPDPDQLLIGSSQTISLADSSSDSSSGSSETFSFTAPASFANGAFSNIEIPIIDFSRFSLAISAFKGIISVFALSIFSKWLIKFAPKLLNGYSSSD